MARKLCDIGFGGYTLVQDTDLYCYGTDAVLLSKFCNALHKDKVVDFCTGNGAIPLIVDALYSPAAITGIELQLSSYLLAEENAKLNHLENKLKFFCGDVKNVLDFIDKDSIDLVTCNPPYFEEGKTLGSSEGPMHIARHETSAKLEDFIKAASLVLKNGGRLCMVHRPSRLADIIELSRENGLEPKRLQMVVPFTGEKANILLIECVKGAGKQLEVLPEIALHTRE
ncbi:MAG: tRNA1(Val) (adenine(37)-N6)-methyltransferase [Clostridia bacterium]|nr:tRNA1(Val) (adenine(37)-N6)-methyltransferase [Clostridia bacterium]